MLRKILIVEDDRDLNSLLKHTFEMDNQFKVYSHFSGSGVLETVRHAKPDLVILDMMLPDVYGLEVLKTIRNDPEFYGILVLFLTAKSDEMDKIEAFEFGADDYLTKPFSPKELILRAKALLRRVSEFESNKNQFSDEKLIVGRAVIDVKGFRITVDGESIVLTTMEFQLMLFLARNIGTNQSRQTLLQQVWGYEGNVNTRTIDTHIKRLRQKFWGTGLAIETSHGFGYCLINE